MSLFGISRTHIPLYFLYSMRMFTDRYVDYCSFMTR